MKEELIKFNTAILAKEKGFSEKCFKQYSETGYLMRIAKSADCVIGPYEELLIADEDCYTAPTQSLLQKWIREKYGIHIQVENVNVPKKEKWIYEIMRLPIGAIVLWNEETSPIFDTFEEALEAGLYEALKLINK